MLENIHAQRLSLNGEWYISSPEQSGRVQVPGVWERQGYSAATSVAVYYRLVDVPENWAGARIMLRCGAVSYRCEVWVNAVEIDAHDGLWSPFEFDVTHALQPGLPNEIELRIVKPNMQVDQTLGYRDVLVGFIPYVATTFGGPWQDVELVAYFGPAFADLHVSADWRTGQVAVRAGVVDSAPGVNVVAEVLDAQGQVVAQTTEPGSEAVSLTLTVDHPLLWSPASPHLYRLRLRMVEADQLLAETERSFGFRQLHTKDDQLYLNWQRIHLRGVLSWGWDPATLAPMPSAAAIRAEFRRVRELGFNLVKLCLFVPPERVFEIADEEGMLLWLELPMWWQRMSGRFRQQTALEYGEILQRVHHHPSTVIYSLGCELSADMADAALLADLNTLARNTTSGALLCDNSGSGEAYKGLAFDYADFNDYHFYCDLHYFTPLLDHFRRDWRPARPWFFGEFCDCDDYRNPAAYLDDGQRPWWRDVLGVEGNENRWAYSEQEQRMSANRLPFSDERLTDISRRQSLLVRKTIIEQVRSRPEMGGYVVTGLRDTPISTSGVFDDHNQPKHRVEDWRLFNADAVLVLEQGRARVWKNGGDRPDPVDRFNYWSGAPVSFRLVLANADSELTGGELRWQLIAPGGTVAVAGSTPVAGPLSASAPREIASLEWIMPEVQQAGEYTLQVNLAGEVVNEWPLWLYPALPAWPDTISVYDPGGALADLADLPQHDFARASGGVLISSVYTPGVEAYLYDGGRVILLQTGAGALPARPVPFWREAIKLLYDHSILRPFPHRGHVDLQFYHLATDYAFDSAAFPAPVTPVIRRLDARVFSLLDYLVEAHVGPGRLLASTLRFFGGAGDQVQGLKANVAGHFLLYQMVDYLRHVE